MMPFPLRVAEIVSRIDIFSPNYNDNLSLLKLGGGGESFSGCGEEQPGRTAPTYSERHFSFGFLLIVVGVNYSLYSPFDQGALLFTV